MTNRKLDRYDTIQLVSWKQIVKKYGYGKTDQKGTRFGIQLTLDGMMDTQFIWCETNLERKRLAKHIMHLAKKEGRDLKLID
tara:strand:+ start:80 stop:325 length:246 start_codon:yes stop_codon:yes gene_type:complete